MPITTLPQAKVTIVFVVPFVIPNIQTNSPSPLENIREAWVFCFEGCQKKKMRRNGSLKSLSKKLASRVSHVSPTYSWSVEFSKLCLPSEFALLNTESPNIIVLIKNSFGKLVKIYLSMRVDKAYLWLWWRVGLHVSDLPC